MTTSAGGSLAARTGSAWVALDRALVRRAQAAVAAGTRHGTDPATALLIAQAAVPALTPGLGPWEREQAESELTTVIGLTGLTGLVDVQVAVELRRRLYNEAVLRWRRRVGSRRRARVPALFETAEPLGGTSPPCTPGLRLRTLTTAAPASTPERTGGPG